MIGELDDHTIAVLGGTGPRGRGLARRFATAGLTVVIGSRSPERARATADEIERAVGAGAVIGAANVDAAGQGDIVIVAVPWEGHRD